MAIGEIAGLPKNCYRSENARMSRDKYKLYHPTLLEDEIIEAYRARIDAGTRRTTVGVLNDAEKTRRDVAGGSATRLDAQSGAGHLRKEVVSVAVAAAERELATNPGRRVVVPAGRVLRPASTPEVGRE